ncbi:hypothetical protein [Sphingopyxis sp. NJF-3]
MKRLQWMEFIMPRGPQGQKRPADVIGNAIMVGRIATGDLVDETTSGAGRSAGGIGRAKALSQAKRREIASGAARARWHKDEMENDMTHTAQKETTATSGREAVRMYPNNSLRDPVREFENTVLTVVKNTFTK